MQSCAVLVGEWREPIDVAASVADEPFALVLLSDGSGDGRWSYVLRRPEATLVLGPRNPGDVFAAAARLLGHPAPLHPDGPPFQGGVAGLAAYEAAERAEPAMPHGRHPDWPDLAAGRYLSVLAFDHQAGRLFSVARAATPAEAERQAAADLDWALSAPAFAGAAAAPLADRFEPVTSPAEHQAAVASIVAAIGRGDIFQANYAGVWEGRLRAGAHPFDLFASLAARSPAPFAAYMRLPGRALVSNSPERFLSVAPTPAGFEAVTRPIKGTAPRGATPEADAAYRDALAASLKDRAENLMIVDLMRNDLSRLCLPGSVEAPVFCEVETFANVHHLVSTVRGDLAPGRSALDLMAAAFPAGSISGAPKIEAMKVIARHEPPRGPFFGSLFWAGVDGSLDANVLIRTVGLVEDVGGWRLESRAGGGITADSEPVAERLEAETKIKAIQGALLGGA